MEPRAAGNFDRPDPIKNTYDAEIREALEENLRQPQKPITASLDKQSMEMIKQLGRNGKPKEVKDVSARVFLAGMLIWFSWLGVNIMAGLEINSDRAAFLFKPDANFLATLGYMAIGAASVVTGTVVADKMSKPK